MMGTGHMTPCGRTGQACHFALRTYGWVLIVFACSPVVYNALFASIQLLFLASFSCAKTQLFLHTGDKWSPPALPLFNHAAFSFAVNHEGVNRQHWERGLVSGDFRYWTLAQQLNSANQRSNKHYGSRSLAISDTWSVAISDARTQCKPRVIGPQQRLWPMLCLASQQSTAPWS